MLCLNGSHASLFQAIVSISIAIHNIRKAEELSERSIAMDFLSNINDRDELMGVSLAQTSTKSIVIMNILAPERCNQQNTGERISEEIFKAFN